MQILFKDPNYSAATPCVAEVQSVHYHDGTSRLVFYGSFMGKPTTIYTTTNKYKAKKMISLMAQENYLDCTNFFSRFVQKSATITIELNRHN